jgi:hypothetical protein
MEGVLVRQVLDGWEDGRGVRPNRKLGAQAQRRHRMRMVRVGRRAVFLVCIVAASSVIASCHPSDGIALLATSTIGPKHATDYATLQASPSPVLMSEPYPISTPLPTLQVLPYPAATFDATVSAIVAAKQTDAAMMGLTLTAQPTSLPEPTGIFSASGPLAVSGFGVIDPINYWRGTINGREAIVIAGVVANTSRGVVFVQMRLPNRWHSDGYVTPVEEGPVHIVAERQGRIELVSAKGTTLYFDVPGLRYVSSASEAVPTITPESSSLPFP